MSNNYRDLAVPQLSLSSSRRLLRSNDIAIPTRDTFFKEPSIASSRYTTNSNSSKLIINEMAYTCNVQKNTRSKLTLADTFGQVSFANIQNNVEFCNQNANRISCNPYMQEKDDTKVQEKYKSTQICEKPPRPSSLNRWGVNSKYTQEIMGVRTQKTIQYAPQTLVNPEKNRIFTPNLLNTQHTTHALIQEQIREKMLLKEFDASTLTFEARLRSVLEQSDSYHRQLSDKYNESRAQRRVYERSLKQLSAIRNQASELNSSMIFKMNTLCQV